MPIWYSSVSFQICSSQCISNKTSKSSWFVCVCVCVHRSWLVKLAWKSRFDNNYKELRFLTGGKNWTPLKYLKMEFMRVFDGKNMFGIQWTWIWILVPLPNLCDFKQIFNLSKPMKIGVMSYRIARRFTYMTV